MRAAALFAILCTLAPCPGRADTLIFPTPPQRGRPLDVFYRLRMPGAGTGILRLAWSDALGRSVEQRRIAFALHGSSDVAFRLDTARAVATLNRLQVHLSFRGRKPDGTPDRREADVTASFIVPPASGAWRDYQIVMWQPQTAAADAALARIGVNAGKVQANRAVPRELPQDQIVPILHRNLRFYVENIATDFYSAYHRWFPGHPVNWRFTAAQQLYRAGDPVALRRDPSLSDPTWLRRIHDRLVATVTAFRAYRPLYYDLADEPGIADLAAYWDFDFSPASLAAMRRWLKTQYPDLAALNREWGTEFPSWDRVLPPTTGVAMQRRDQNFAAWGDFKRWMDVAFARAVGMGRDAVHAADPQADAAIEGVQVPGWGGYDYARLAGAVDVMETGVGNVGMIRSLAPGMIILTTSFGSGAADAHRVWRAFLDGARGLILWDDQHQFVNDAAVLGNRGVAAAPYFSTLRNGLGAVVIDSRRLTSPVDILYSPASMRAQWMLDWKDKGDAWTRRGAAAEGGSDNTVRAAMAAYADALAALGLEPRFIAAAELAHGKWPRDGCRVLILPHAIALSPDAADAIRRFVAAGGTAIADTAPGRFDGHVRRLDRPLLSDLFGTGPSRPAVRAFGRGEAVYLGPRATNPPTAHFGPHGLSQLRRLLGHQGIVPFFAIRSQSGAAVTDVGIHVFRHGPVTIVGLDRRAPSPAAAAEPIVLSLPRRPFVYDLRAGTSLGRRDHLALGLDPFQPTILALSPRRQLPPTIAVPSSLHQGDVAALRLGLAGPTDAARHVLHVAVIDPAGRSIVYDSGNIRVQRGTATWRIPLALNDPGGIWRVKVTDALSGMSATAPMAVLPRRPDPPH